MTPAGEILDALRGIVGHEGVLDESTPGFREAYTDPFAFDDRSSRPPLAAVRPVSVEQVQEIVRAANTYGFELWVVSRGRNFGYGGASARKPGSIIVDLQLMNRIRSVDVEGAFAVVEPGVTFHDLSDYVRGNDLPLIPSVPDIGWGSIIGNALERGFGYAAYGEHGNYLCGLEVVLPSGELVRTGMGALPGSAHRHRYRGGYGPGVDGLFQQSNLGIVVSAGIWLFPRPEIAAAVLVSVRGDDELATLVDTLRPLMLERTIDSVVIVGNTLAIASGIMPRSAVTDDPTPMSDESLDALAAQLGVGRWNAKFGIYGPHPIVAAKIEVVRAAVERAGGTMTVREYPGDVRAADVHPADRAPLGVPSDDLIQMAAWRGGEPAHTDFSVVSSALGSEAERLVGLVKTVVESEGMDHVGGFTMFGRHAVMLSLLAFDRGDPEERSRVARLFARLIDEAGRAGFAPYRAHTVFMDAISDLYSTEDYALRKMVTTIKDALDPRGILSPGKQGIWPRGQRPDPE